MQEVGLGAGLEHCKGRQKNVNPKDFHREYKNHCCPLNTGWKNSTAAQSAEKNKTLSLQRAQSVQNHLLGQGVSSIQIRSVEGLGQDYPVADNSTAAGQAQNRRVEVYLYPSKAMIEAANNGTLQ